VVWLPRAGRDCHAFAVGTKVVVQPVCSQYKQLLDTVHISVVMECDGLLQ